MATEIERKFLLKDDSWRQSVERSTLMRQGYLIGAKKASVRVRVSGDKAALNIKSARLGISRKEYEVALPGKDAEEILEDLCEEPLIEKTRHIVNFEAHTWEVDEFHGANAGLVVAEIELGSEEESFIKPPWIGEEVSHDPRYYNVCLIKHPYKDW